MIRLVVFDFDGTLVDSKKVLFDLIVFELKNRHFKVNKLFVKDFGNRPLDDSLKILGVQEKVMPILVNKINGDFKKYSYKVKLVKNLRKLSELKTKKIILSNNSRYFIKEVLKVNKIDFFSEIFGAEDFDVKYNQFRKILKKYSVKPQEIVYVGDRPIDSKLARKIGCISVLISNPASWSSRDDLIKSSPDFLIKDLNEIKKIVDKLNFI